MRPRIALDICNTIADVNAVLEAVLGPRPDPSGYRHPAATPEFFRRHPEVFADAMPLPGAVEGANLLAENWEIVYLTARPEWSRRITLEWLKQWGFPEGEIVFSQNKGAMARSLGVNLALDDAPHEIRSYRAAGVPVLAYAQPYNAGLGPRFRWAKVAYNKLLFEV